MTDLTSRPYHPDPEKCCERCVFGSGNLQVQNPTPHAPWCKHSWRRRHGCTCSSLEGEQHEDGCARLLAFIEREGGLRNFDNEDQPIAGGIVKSV